MPPATVRVRLKETVDYGREVPDVGDVAPGETLEVPAAVAGRPPAGTPGEDDFDPGAGLLAQVDVWETAPKKTTATRKDA